MAGRNKMLRVRKAPSKIRALKMLHFASDSHFPD